MLCNVLCVSAQTVSGFIYDQTFNEPLIGANVVVKGTTTGTNTDFDGAFSFKVDALPVTLEVSYIGYITLDYVYDGSEERPIIMLSEDAITTEVIEVKGRRISEKAQAAPQTLVTLDLQAIKETASDNFYDGLGALKGVDLTAASLGFKVINTRGFNSTSPVRSLQLIDGVDNQAPGLNFSLGNFLGASELDVLKVDLIVGAASPLYGPNAFNGVISMTTKDPFFHKGLSAEVKFGERNLRKAGVRWADAFKNKDGQDYLGYKISFEGFQADDWEAENYDPVFDSRVEANNPGRFDAVNIYGDEYQRRLDNRGSDRLLPGAGVSYRTGYREVDLVDYDTENFKGSAAVHLRTNPSKDFESPELIYGFNYGRGTTVYQGENRFSLRNIQFFQHRLEFRKKDKFFLRFYTTRDDAGDSYDPYFTALQLQERAKPNEEWATNFRNYWRTEITPRAQANGFPEPTRVTGEDGIPRLVFDQDAVNAWESEFRDSLTIWNAEAAAFADLPGTNSTSVAKFEPGTARFDSIFNAIVSNPSTAEDAGTRFIDRSSLYHVQGEYNFAPDFLEYWKVGVSSRLYTPDSEGTIFIDTGDVSITNFEYGVYTGIEKKFGVDRWTFNATMRMDKNQNFDYLFTPAASLVYKPSANNYLRASFSSGVRNPTLSDQYLNLNVGPATLAGNLDGVQNLVTIESLREYFNQIELDRSVLDSFSIAPIRPERVRTFELGYRTTLFDKLYVDAGYYFSTYTDFIGFQIGADVELNSSGTPDRLDVFRFAANSANTVTTQGASVGINYYFGKYFLFNGNYSWNRLNTEVDDPIIPAFNPPEHKFNVGITGRDIDLNLGLFTLARFGFNINYKYIEGFLFEGSPQFTGLVPTYGLLDGQINWQKEDWNMTFKLGASNILDQRNFQTYGGPRIGRLAYFSINYVFKHK